MYPVNIYKRLKLLQKKLSLYSIIYQWKYHLAFTSEIEEGHLENIGFIGKEIVFRLTEIGIGTCWLGCEIFNKNRN